MRRTKKRTRVRVNYKRLAISILVLLLVIGGLVFAITRIADAVKERKNPPVDPVPSGQQGELNPGGDADLAKEARELAKANGFLVLLNKTNPVAEEHKPADLVSIDESYCCPDRPAETHLLRSEAADAFCRMIDAAKADGLEIKMTTAYRSYSYQNALYTNYVSKYGQEQADRFSAAPGTSEHQSGLSSDISAASVDWSLTNRFGETEEGKWIAAHCAEYGFIIRYPETKSEERTGYIYEPWHVRYVTVPVATEMMKDGLVLEEYLEKYDLTK